MTFPSLLFYSTGFNSYDSVASWRCEYLLLIHCYIKAWVCRKWEEGERLCSVSTRNMLIALLIALTCKAARRELTRTAVPSAPLRSPSPTHASRPPSSHLPPFIPTLTSDTYNLPSTIFSTNPKQVIFCLRRNVCNSTNFKFNQIEEYF